MLKSGQFRRGGLLGRDPATEEQGDKRDDGTAELQVA
jgi:hypothetical protein